MEPYGRKKSIREQGYTYILMILLLNALIISLYSTSQPFLTISLYWGLGALSGTLLMMFFSRVIDKIYKSLKLSLVVVNVCFISAIVIFRGEPLLHTGFVFALISSISMIKVLKLNHK
jgi:hypothetical protein